MRETRTLIHSLVLPRDASCEQITLFQGMCDCLSDTVQRFHAVQTGALAPFEVDGMWPEPHNDAIGRLDIRFLDDGGQVLNASATSWSLAGTWRRYFLTEDNLPFGGSMLEERYSNAVESVRLVFRYRNINFYSGQRVCIIWNVEVTYDILATSGILRPNFTIAQENCNHPTCVRLRRCAVG
jgi:hypothetical protein